MISDLSNKTKILDSFKQTGKGGVIELEGEPIFPLKMTLDFILQDYNNCRFNISTIKASDSQLKSESPAKRAFKESKNVNNMSDYSSSSKVVEVTGSVYNPTGKLLLLVHQFVSTVCILQESVMKTQHPNECEYRK